MIWCGVVSRQRSEWKQPSGSQGKKAHRRFWFSEIAEEIRHRDEDALRSGFGLRNSMDVALAVFQARRASGSITQAVSTSGMIPRTGESHDSVFGRQNFDAEMNGLARVGIVNPVATLDDQVGTKYLPVRILTVTWTQVGNRAPF
jgi:hypothetical protein